MLKKTIKYTDFNDVEREEDFYFNISKSELAEWQLSRDGGLDEALKKMIQEKRVPEIIATLKDIILKAYGEKSEDGKYFMKSDDISNRFYHSEAYTELFMEISASPESAAAFINGILPEEIRKQIALEEAKNKEVADSNA